MAVTDMMTTLLVQARLGWEKPAENRAHLANLIEAHEGKFDLAVFPETFTTGFLGDPDLPSEGMDGPTVEWLAQLAARYDSAICGSAVIVEDGQRFNRFLFATPDGNVRFYDKRHLFGFGGENKRYAAGQERVVWQYGPWRICPQVCYDLRFPVWCRNQDDYDLMIFVANWPGKRVAHWSALLRARAIENQAWVLAVNRVGEDGNGIAYPGSSHAFDPLGESRVEFEPVESCKAVELDLGQVREVRRTFPFQADADRFRLD